MLSKHPDLCKFPHGHSRKVEFVLESDDLDGNEMVCDFKSLKEAMSAFLKAWDHALCVNTQDAQHDTLKRRSAIASLVLKSSTPPRRSWPAVFTKN